ncbi:putative late blight resistance protein homolog R1A-3 [Diospyros lotus]|uniref:putative late blight resistance protein homolog R1A-3 n=1 Tax=Diospyros lotus TaxID=55363 RepID=UPI00224EB843|nr:putative late blight resistance protein homolog R1A-3 [Diospyros lotus]XP_052196915.1 putative late blight resistance protein homolog R1A-3 [Diospyros lotus]XP_052196916.1 putative late blight resistance protein homolog R1A-3 [Diospyros lotus]
MDDSDDEERYVLRPGVNDFGAKFKSIMTANVDMATKVSLITDHYMDFLGKSPDDPESAYDLWYAEVVVWLTSMLQKRPEDRSIYVKTDDRVADAVWYVGLKSFVLLTGWMVEPMFLQKYFNFEELAFRDLEPVLLHRLLSYYHHFGEEDAIEKCWEFENFRDNIMEAAELARCYISSYTERRPLPDNNYEDNILTLLERSLTGKYLLQEYGTSAFRPEMDKRLLQEYGSDMDKRLAKDRKDGLVPQSGGLETIKEYLNKLRAKVRENELVGRSGDLEKIMERLIAGTSELGITPIVGMGGIGKTTLARSLYEDAQIQNHFRVRGWIRVSQEFRERDVITGLLESIGLLNSNISLIDEDNTKLGERLRKHLLGRKYLIVIDDLWTTEAWDCMKWWFEDKNNGSRILLTSRLHEVASYVNHPYPMNLLSPEDSWKLLCKQAFGTEGCPPELLNIGKQIANKCQGHPLSVIVVAGHLSNIGKTKHSWENVAKTMDSLIDGSQENFNILSLSYNGLTQDLKACFLSLVIFPKNSDIPVRKLIRMWAGMGFVHPEPQKSTEEVAQKCFEDLIRRNLIIAKKKKFDGKVNSCGIHDLLWDLSMREARKEGDYIFGHSPLSHPYFNTDDDMKYALGLTHTLLYSGRSFESDCPLSSAGFELLKILDILNQPFDDFPHEITDRVNLRYLALSTSADIPDSVSKLCYLETLINNHQRAGGNLPKEIWLMPRLRHLHVGTCTYLPNPSSLDSVLTDLQTLSTLSSASCTKEIFENMPNLEELGIHQIRENARGDELCLSSLVYLHKLQKLKITCNLRLANPRSACCWESFLPNITQLTLLLSRLPWHEINALALLPKLEVLKLKNSSFEGPEWVQNNEGFPKLKFLLLESLDLEDWIAKHDHFPKLEWLVVRYCVNLTKIPLDFGEICTLQLIDMEYCNLMAFESARSIQVQQLNVGNEKLIVRLGRMLAEQKLIALTVAFIYMTAIEDAVD